MRLNAKLSHDALLIAAQVLRLEADSYRGRDAYRQDKLYQVAEALLLVANGAGIIEMEE